MPDLLAAKVASDPDGVAIAVYRGSGLTYRAWSDRSEAMAGALVDRGVHPGDRVALVFDLARWVDGAAAYLSVQRAGGVPVPLAPRFLRLDLLRVLDHCKATGLVCPSDLAPPGSAGWVATVEELESGRSEPSPDMSSPVHGTAELLYAARVLRVPHALAVSHTEAVAAPQEWPAVEAGTFVHALPLGTSAGQEVLRLSLRQGGPVVAVDIAGFDPGRLWAAVGDRRATGLGLPGWMAAALIESIDHGAHDLSSVSQVVVVGDVSPTTLARLATVFPRAEMAVVPDLGSEPRPRSTAPASPSQEAMVWQELLAPRSLNRTPVLWRCQGPLDVTALEAALDELVRRQASLRTTFTTTGGKLAQVVTPHRHFEVPVIDVSHMPPAEQGVEVRNMVAEGRRQPFDLAVGPLFHPVVVRLGADDHVLVIRAHHSVCDDASMVTISHDLSALYAIFHAGGTGGGQPSCPPELVELPEQFADVCRRRQAALDGGRGHALLEHWREVLAGAPLSVQLPLGEPDQRPGGGPPPLAKPVSIELPPGLGSALHALADGEGAALSTVVLAAVAVLVQRLTGQDDVVLSTLASGREPVGDGQGPDGPELDGLAGCFATTVLLRLRLNGDRTVSGLIASTSRTLAEAVANQGQDGQAVLQHVLGPDAATHGLVPHVGVHFQTEVTIPPPTIAEAVTTSLDLTATAAQAFPFGTGTTGAAPHSRGWGAGLYFGSLGLSVADKGGTVTVDATGAFPAATVTRLLAGLRAVLETMVADPEQRLSSLVYGLNADPPVLAGDDRLDLRGFRVDLRRLQGALGECPGVRDVAVAVREERPGDQRLVAYVVADDAGAPPLLADLRQQLWSRLPGYAWPSVLVLVEAIPAGGEIDVTALPGPDAHPDEDSATTESRCLSAAWTSAYDGDRVAPDADYWGSFPFLDALEELHQAGAVVENRQVLRNRTLQTLAADIAASPQGAVRQPSPHQASAHPPPLPSSTAKSAPAAEAGRHRRWGRRWRVDLHLRRNTFPSAARALTAASNGSGDVISTHGLTKRYPSAPGSDGKDLIAVDDLGLSVRLGEVFGLLGPNGAGKTTTVGMLTTRVVPTAGRAVVHGVDVVADPARAKRFIGVVPQANTLDRSLTVAENLWFHARYFGMGASQATAATDEALERFHLAGRARSGVHTLSGGMAQRLMVARSILHHPAVLFLDEPTAGLDPQSRLALWDIVAELHDAGQTILLTTHYMEEADRMCDRVAIMDHGRVLALDTPERLKQALAGDGDAVNLETVFINLTGRDLRE